MTQRITWSKSVKIITTVSLILIIGAGLLTIFSPTEAPKEAWEYAIGITLLLIVPITFLFSPVCLENDGEHIIIHKVVGRKRIKIEDIAATSIYERNRGNIRVFGSGGLFGYFGRFHNRKHGHYTAYAGDLDQAFYITTKSNKTYLVSCNNRDEFIRSMQAD